MDLVERLIASSCSENCLMGKAAKEIERLRRIEAAAVKAVGHDVWKNDEWYDDMVALTCVLQEGK